MVWEGEEEMVFEGKVKISYWEGDIRDQSWEQRESALVPGFSKGVSSSSAGRPGGKLCLIPFEGSDHRITGWMRLEGDSSGDAVQLPCSSRDTWSQLPVSMSRWLLGILKGGHSATSVFLMFRGSLVFSIASGPAAGHYWKTSCGIWDFSGRSVWMAVMGLEQSGILTGFWTVWVHLLLQYVHTTWRTYTEVCECVHIGKLLKILLCWNRIREKKLVLQSS